MERSSEKSNGSVDHGAPDPTTAFFLADPVTDEKHLVRDMDDATLGSFRNAVAHVSQVKMKAVIARLQLVLNPLDTNMCIGMFEEAMVNAALLMVIQYEQNRRANLPAETVA